MTNDIDYKQKYLKYKQKYNSEKKKLSGGIIQGKTLFSIYEDNKTVNFNVNTNENDADILKLTSSANTNLKPGDYILTTTQNKHVVYMFANKAFTIFRNNQSQVDAMIIIKLFLGSDNKIYLRYICICNTAQQSLLRNYLNLPGKNQQLFFNLKQSITFDLSYSIMHKIISYLLNIQLPQQQSVYNKLTVKFIRNQFKIYLI